MVSQWKAKDRYEGRLCLVIFSSLEAVAPGHKGSKKQNNNNNNKGTPLLPKVQMNEKKAPGKERAIL